ncbi:MAG: TlpA family protein disulfide reductase [Blastocatellia bacterium]|nr:TlpA family protein disulfide reductase [Blastocatellia bacterium]
MLEINEQAPEFSLPALDGTLWRLESQGRPTLLVFFETDCPTCRLTIPYLNRLARELGEARASVVGISQDGERPTREMAEQLPIMFPVVCDRDLKVSRLYDPLAVPTIFLLDRKGKIIHTQTGFDKDELNLMAELCCEEAGAGRFVIAHPHDGAPQSKPGCTSRHLEPAMEGDPAAVADLYVKRGARASRIELPDSIDPYDYLMQAGVSDPLPVIPPTVERVRRCLERTPLPPEEVIGLIPPNYGAATVEKIAANAVMAGCRPELIEVLIPLVRAACDERFNMHGVQATTHFAAPLVIVNGPVRASMGFACASNVFSNVTRANSTVGRALQLILTNLGGARPGEIDMSTLGNPGKFSYCIAENEEESAWEPLHVERGFEPDCSAVTLWAAEPPHGVSEHNAREGRQILRAISRALATVWSYRLCIGVEAMVVLCPEHVKTLRRDRMTKQQVREWLFENTGIPVKEYTCEGEGTQYVKFYKEAVIDGEPCYLKFQDASAIKIIVAGGTAGKFSAVLGSWAAGPRGSQMVTYPVSVPRP